MALRNEPYPARSVIGWGAVVAGAVIGVAVMALLTTLFVALGSEADAISRNLHWYGFASAIVALFVAGLLAGWLSASGGTVPGLLHGVTVWGLILVVTLAFPFPQAFGLFEVFATPLPDIGTGPLWAAFLSLLIGLIAAAAGGAIGGTFVPLAGASAAPGYAAGTAPGPARTEPAAAEPPRTEPAPTAPPASDEKAPPRGRRR